MKLQIQPTRQFKLGFEIVKWRNTMSFGFWLGGLHVCYIVWPPWKWLRIPKQQ